MTCLPAPWPRYGLSLEGPGPDTDNISFQAEELDQKVRDLWSRLSCPEAAFDQLLGQQQSLEMSVNKLKSDLDQSIMKNNKLQQNVSFSKRLFK